MTQNPPPDPIYTAAHPAVASSAPNQQTMEFTIFEHEIDPALFQDHDVGSYFILPASSQQNYTAELGGDDIGASSDRVSENHYVCDTCGKPHRRQCDLE